MFIVIEGIDGSGKSSAIKIALSYLAENYGIDALVTSELSLITPWGRGFRERLNRAGGDPEIEYEVVLEARENHVQYVLHPALDVGRVVLQDRYVYSTLAYQGQSESVTARQILDDHLARNFPAPDVVIFMAVTPATAAKRIQARGKADAFDSRGRDFFARANEIYINNVNILQARGSSQAFVIDAELCLELVERDIQIALDEVFAKVAV